MAANLINWKKFQIEKVSQRNMWDPKDDYMKKWNNFCSNTCISYTNHAFADTLSILNELKLTLERKQWERKAYSLGNFDFLIKGFQTVWEGILMISIVICQK